MRLLFPILLIGLAIATFFMFIDPQYGEVKVLKGKIAQYEAALQVSNDVKKQKSLLAEEDRKIANRNDGKDEERLGKILPRRIDTIKFILDINHFAVLQNVFLKNIVIGSAGKSASDASAKGGAVTRLGSYQATGFSFSVSASYEGFASLMDAIERNLEVMDVTSVTFNSTDSNIYDFSIAGNVYSVE